MFYKKSLCAPTWLQLETVPRAIEGHKGHLSWLLIDGQNERSGDANRVQQRAPPLMPAMATAH